MLRYKAGYKYVDGGVHAQVLDFRAAITCAGDLAEARRLLGIALVDAAEAAVESGQPLPVPDSEVFDAATYQEREVRRAIEEAES
ncbi:MAG: type II toxin-antitoxin system HicB family antitoxin [Isosphaeraceae bacterium]